MDAQLIGSLKFAIRQFVAQRAGLFPSPQIGLCWAIALEAVAGEIRALCPEVK